MLERWPNLTINPPYAKNGAQNERATKGPIQDVPELDAIPCDVVE